MQMVPRSLALGPAKKRDKVQTLLARAVVLFNQKLFF